MKKILLIFLISLVAAAVYYFYTEYTKAEKFDPWQLIPSNSAIVIETRNAKTTWDKFQLTDIGEGLKNTEIFHNINLFFNSVDSLSGLKNGADLLLNNKLQVSVVPLSQDQFSLIYVLPIIDTEIQKVLSNINESFTSKGSFTLSTRTYLDQTIHEVIVESTHLSFAYIYFKNHLVISRSAFLVESVIRQINNKENKNFYVHNKGLFSLPALTNDDANVYLNYGQFGKWLKTFVKPSNTNFFNPLEDLNGGAAMDLTISQNSLIFNGFSLSYESTNLFPHQANQNPGRISNLNLIPGNAEYVWTYNFSDKELFPPEVAKWIDREISYIGLPSIKEDATSRLLLIQAKDPGQALNHFNLLAEKAAKEDTVYREHYAGYPLTEITPLEWPEKFLKMYEKQDQSFFTIINNVIAVSNNLETLKILIEDIENENTWGKNLSIRQYVQLGLEEVNMSLFIHPENYWRSLLANSSSQWEEKFTDYSTFLKGFVICAFQINRLQDKYYTTALFGYEPQETLSSGDRNLNIRFTTTFDNPLSSQPFIVRNHNTNKFEIIMQDEQNNLTLLDWEGNKIWMDSIQTRIKTDVHQIDFYNNDKLQYFFTGDNEMFIIDRNGENVEDYPISIGSRNIQFASLIDYDNSKNYRFALADDQGSIYLVDKHGKILEGWNPKKLQGELSEAPFHVRIRGKDYIVVVQKRGIVHLFSRRGEYYPNFPINLEERISGRIFLQKGSDMAGSILTLVTENGQLIKINLEGKIITKENLYRPTRESKFYVVPEAQNKSFIIVREGLNRVSILNEKGDRRFEKDYLSIDPLKIQYYNFGLGKEIIAITDQEQQFTYLYNESGDLINNRPINSAEPVAILYFNSTKQFHIFKIYNNTLSSLTF